MDEGVQQWTHQQVGYANTRIKYILQPPSNVHSNLILNPKLRNWVTGALQLSELDKLFQLASFKGVFKITKN